MTLLSGGFWMAWGIGIFVTPYFQTIGFNATRMGLINSCCAGVGIIAMSLWGIFSDKIRSIRKIVVILLIGNAIFYSLTPFLKGWFGLVFWPYFILCPVYAIFRSPSSSYQENLIVRNCNELRLNYGRIRAIGSFVYTIVTILMTAFMDKIGLERTFWLSGLAMIPMIVLFALARDPKGAEEATEEQEKADTAESAEEKAEKTEQKRAKKKQKIDLRPLFRSRTYVFFLIFSALFYIAFYFENSFITFYMKDLGVSTDKFGTLSGFRALLEIPALLFLVNLRKVINYKTMLWLSAFFMGLECILLGTVVNGWSTLLPISGCFGLGSGLFIASSLNYIYEIAPDGLKASGQAFFASISQGASILANLFGGFLYDAIGFRNFYLVAGITFAVSIAVFLMGGRRSDGRMMKKI